MWRCRRNQRAMEDEELSKYLWDYYNSGTPGGPEFRMPESRQHREELSKLEELYRQLLEEQDAEHRKQELKEELLQLEDEYEALHHKQAMCKKIRHLASQRDACLREGDSSGLPRRRRDLVEQKAVDDEMLQVLGAKQRVLQEQDYLRHHFPDKRQPFWVTKKEFEHRLQIIDDKHADLQARIKAQFTVRARCPSCPVRDPRPRSACRGTSPPRHTFVGSRGHCAGQWRPVPRGYFPTHPPDAPRDPRRVRMDVTMSTTAGSPGSRTNLDSTGEVNVPLQEIAEPVTREMPGEAFSPEPAETLFGYAEPKPAPAVLPAKGPGPPPGEPKAAPKPVPGPPSGDAEPKPVPAVPLLAKPLGPPPGPKTPGSPGRPTMTVGAALSGPPPGPKIVPGQTPGAVCGAPPAGPPPPAGEPKAAPKPVPGPPSGDPPSGDAEPKPVPAVPLLAKPLGPPPGPKTPGSPGRPTMTVGAALSGPPPGPKIVPGQTPGAVRAKSGAKTGSWSTIRRSTSRRAKSGAKACSWSAIR
eukprot:symbB.v1.2.028107.t1/scaffold2944.1/size66737/2